MSRIKVLHIITRLNVGGAREVVLKILGNLDKQRYDVILICGPQDADIECEEISKDKIIIIPELIRSINPAKDFIALVKLYRFIKREKFDIVHTHTSKAGILGRIAAKLNNVPVTFHMPHGSIFHPIYYGKPFIFILSKIEKIVALCTDRIIVGSDNEKKDFINNGIGCEDKYVMIPYYFIQDKFKDVKEVDKQALRGELNISNNVLLLANIGRLVPEKGHIFCLKAFRMVIDRIPDAVLMIVGDGGLRKAIERKIIELNLQNNIIMTGFRRDISQILSIVDISLHTSLWEGTPLSIVEDMFLGKTIIATAVGGVTEIIEDKVTGILIEPNDTDELVEWIIRLHNNRELLINLGKEAQKYARIKFNSSFIFDQINKLYDNFSQIKVTRKFS